MRLRISVSSICFFLSCVVLCFGTKSPTRLVAQDDLPTPAEQKVEFERDIAPIFEAFCLDCHGEFDQQSNFRLDRKSSLIRGGDSGEPAILIGKSAESHLIKLIAGLEPDLSMPPDDKLTDEEIGLLRAWIDQGAEWPGPNGVVEQEKLTSDHWSFQPLQDVDVPQTNSAWGSNPIDSFVASKLAENGISASDPADRATLIRRIYLDMLGIPPTPEQVEEFVKNSKSAATNALIEEVLASSHYGERWGRYWLDLVRFAETHGFEMNRERPHAWRYRDYVIESFNNDKPYDQFVREQIAGDVFGNKVALGFLVAGPYDQVKSPDINLTMMQRQNELDDIINTTGTAFLGLTLGCARCHNHKFDPITQTDYYAMQAMFAGVNHADMTLPLSPADQSKVAELDQTDRRLRSQLAHYFRLPVNAKGNTDSFAPIPTRFVRFTVLATTGGEPCIDELSVFSKDQIVSLAEKGAIATASGTLPGYEIHQLNHINDGKFGNSNSWISNENGKGWIQIEFVETAVIDSVEWARDREGKYSDRLPTQYVIECSEDGQDWIEVSSSHDRLPADNSGLDAAIDEGLKRLADEDRQLASKLVSQLRENKAARDKLKQSTIAYAGNYVQPGPTHRLYRGEATAKREQVAPDVPNLFDDLELPMDAREVERRKQLAEWIASPGNPLTARVIVNRIWQFHFGNAIVATPSDFGEGGVPPTHPELLDWLANELIQNDWSLKHIHRLILQSATYQQTSRPNEDCLAVDGATQLLWRFPPRRLEAEPIRDSILAVTGVLDLTTGGPGFSAFEVEEENVRHYHPKKNFGPEDWRRMVYMTKVRMEQDAIFGVFDCPDAATSVPQRTSSTTPLQALNLFNSQFLLQQADLFATRLTNDAGVETNKQVELAFRLCYSRVPTEEELDAATQFINEYDLRAFCRAILNSNEFLFLQ